MSSEDGLVPTTDVGGAMWAYSWLRANVKMRTVEDVRADDKDKISALEAELWLGTKMVEEMKAKVQVLVDALERIESDGKYFVATAIENFAHPLHTARGALKNWRGNE